MERFVMPVIFVAMGGAATLATGVTVFTGIGLLFGFCSFITKAGYE